MAFGPDKTISRLCEPESSMPRYLGAIDQGTTSTRFIVFNRDGSVVASAQKDHDQLYPRPGWVEHDPRQILARTREVIQLACASAGLGPADIASIGITNQRETTVVWDRHTGEPVSNAIVWQDTRVSEYLAAFAADGGKNRFQQKTGLPLATYFSGLKIRWILDHVEGARARAERGDLLFGNIDSYLLFHLAGGVHRTDVTNASRTQLMDLETLDWDEELLRLFTIPASMMPEIHSSSSHFGCMADGPLKGVSIGGILGDQHAALVGQTCFQPGQVKNTYGTGCFLLMNTGRKEGHLQQWPPHHRRLSLRRRTRPLRAGRLHRHRRSPRPVGPRQPRHDPQKRGDRIPRRQRR